MVRAVPLVGLPGRLGCGFGLRLDPSQRRKGLAITLEHGLPLLHPLLQDFQLTKSDSRQDIAHAVVVSQLGVHIVVQTRRIRISRLRAPKTGLSLPFQMARHQHPSGRRRVTVCCHPVRNADVTKGSHLATAVKGSQRMRRILEQRYFISTAEGQNGFEIRTLPIDMHNHNRPGQPIQARAALEEVRQTIDV